ncbi:hypothetical protein [Sphingomonas oryzagri]
MLHPIGGLGSAAVSLCSLDIADPEAREIAMRVRFPFGAVAIVPVLIAATEPGIPIAGSWKAEPSADLLGPASLEISDRSIAFGPNREKIASWTKGRDLFRIDTSSGHSYAFRQETDARLCLVTAIRPAAAVGPGGGMPVRCYTKVQG